MVLLDLGQAVALSPNFTSNGYLIPWHNAIARQKLEKVRQRQRLRDGIRITYYIVKHLYRWLRFTHSLSVAYISTEAVFLHYT